MEQPRVNWDRGRYDVTLVKFWRQTLRTHSVNVIRRELSVTSFHPILVSLLPYFVSQGSMNSLQFKNNCLCCFTEYFATKTQHNNDYISVCSLLCVAGMVLLLH